MTRSAVNLDDLTPEEQLDLLEEIWDRLSQHPASIPLSDAQRSELDRRLDALETDVRAGRPLGRPWTEVQAQRPGLGPAFRRALDIAVTAVENHAEAYAVIHRSTRRVLLPRFPYGLYYRVLEQNIVMVACMHAKRHPRTWRSR